MIGGSVAPGFEEVEREFERNFEQRRELGAACAAYVGGEKVVDLWGGVRDARTRSPWEQDTMVLVYWSARRFTADARRSWPASDGRRRRRPAPWPSFP